jgi:RNA polymerase sigma-70 factor (ECF subfamily)
MAGAADRVLTQGARAVSREALAELLRQHRPLICRLARRTVGGDGDVEDVVQDVLVAIVTGIHRFRGDAKLTTWIAGITMRTAIRHAQRSRRRNASATLLGSRAEQLSNSSRTAGDPAELVETREFLDHLQAAIRTLPPQQRAVIVLRHFEGMPLQQVAEALGTPVGTVKSRLHHARRTLRNLMAPYLSGEIGR